MGLAGDTEKNWYVARIESQFGALRIIERHLEAFGMRHCQPTILEQRGGKMSRRALYPGYIFIEMDGQPPSIGLIYSISQIKHLLPIRREKPVPLKKGYVDEVLRLQTDGLLNDEAHEEALRRYLPGDRIPITSGPFAGHTGILKRSTHGSFEILCSLLGRETRVTVPKHQVARPTRSFTERMALYLRLRQLAEYA